MRALPRTRQPKKLTFGQMPLCGQTDHARVATTLMEVLMALMVMSIGIVSVASLFPLAILRSIQASQLTNAALLRYEAEDKIDMFEDMLPDGDDFPTPRRVGDRRRFVIDPLGYWTTQADDPGNEGQWKGTITRLNAGMGQNLANNAIPSADSWVREFQGLPASNTGSVITFPNKAIDALRTLETIVTARIGSGTAANPENPDIQARLVLLSENGRSAVTREVSDTANINTGARTVTLDTALPSDGRFDSISEVYIETYEQRYSFLFTVRSTLVEDIDGDTTTTDDMTIENVISCVVFFRRDFNEQVFNARSRRRTDGGEMKIFFETSRDRPKFKPGDYLFDPDNAYWYQVRQVVADDIEDTGDEDEDSNTNRLSQIILDRAPLKPINRVIVTDGIIEVFPISTRISG